MKCIEQLRNELKQGVYTERFCRLYCCGEEGAAEQTKRYLQLLNGLERTFGQKEQAALFSAPGRTEIGGNHTDHQQGRVLAGSVNLDMIAAVSWNGSAQLRVQSEGYDLCVSDLQDLEPHTGEENTTAALLRGSCKAYAQRGAKLQGLDVYISSSVPPGSGVSSSAAFEVLIGTVLNSIWLDGRLSAVEVAQIGQWVENIYFGKPCGLMDQMASSVGNIVTIDFCDPAEPVVQPVNFDFAQAGLALCILDCGADHADLTDEYAAVPFDCKAVAAVCGEPVLRKVPYAAFVEKLPVCRVLCGDRAVLRAMHFYAENDRVPQQVDALNAGNLEEFLRLVTESGHSSWECLQNVIPAGSKAKQEMAVAIAVAKTALRGRGAVRVHGGGFAGTIQAFVPLEMLTEFKKATEAVLGEGRCHVLSIRPEGGVKI